MFLLQLSGDAANHAYNVVGLLGKAVTGTTN